MTDLELFDFAQSKIDTHFSNQNSQIELSNDIYEALQDHIEMQQESDDRIYDLIVDQIERQSEKEALIASEEVLETFEEVPEEVPEDTYTLDEFLIDSKEFQEQQLEILESIKTNQEEQYDTLVGIKETVETQQKIDIVSVSFLGVLVGVVLASILAKYLKN